MPNVLHRENKCIHTLHTDISIFDRGLIPVGLTLSLQQPYFQTCFTSFMLTTFSQLGVVLTGRYDRWCRWPALCWDCLPEICINKAAVPACPRCCPGASTFAYRAVIGLPWVPSATAEQVGGRQRHKWVLNWNLTAALHFICVWRQGARQRVTREDERKGTRKREREKNGNRHMAEGKNR